MATTWNPSDKGANVTLSGGNLTASFGSTSPELVRSVLSLGSGKYYWETILGRSGGTFADVDMGLANSTASLIFSSGGFGASGDGHVYIATVDRGLFTSGSLVNGDRVCHAYDATAKLYWARKGTTGDWNGSPSNNPATGVGGYDGSPVTGTLLLAADGDTDGTLSVTLVSSSAGTVPSGFTDVMASATADESINNTEFDAAQTAIFADWLAANEAAVQDRSWVQALQSTNTVYNDTLNEAGSAVDTVTGLLSTAGAVSETGSASETVSGAIVSTNAVSEAGSASETVSAAQVFAGGLAESGTAAETLTGLLSTANAAVAETASAADSPAGLLSTADSISESGSAVDTTAGGSLYAQSLSETATATDTPAAALSVTGSITETGSAADTVSAVAASVEAIAEAGSASDAVASTLSSLDNLAETASAVDTVTALANQVYNEALFENAVAIDTVDADGGTVPNADTHDPGGYWSKKWAAIRARAKRKPDREDVEEVLETVFTPPLKAAAPELVAKAKTAIRQGLAAQTEATFDRKIAQVEALMAQAIEQAERQDEEDLVLVLMEMMDA